MKEPSEQEVLRMASKLMEELMELIEQVPDKYDDFVGGMEIIMKKQDNEDIQSVIDFIKEKPARTSSDILDYLDELGI